MTLQAALTTLALAMGIFFVAVTVVGFRRLPDIFCRLHVLGIIDTLGVPLILLAAAIHAGPTLAAFKLILALALIAITSPIIGHLLARAALEAGHQPGVIETPAEVPPAAAWSGGGAQETR
ncbi:MAG TPA: monovalent cation/H(+) antiporter subunit G [Vicinamibacterales bacterium]|nr:monovalent cation/H(+) antiporter subunit G [Vicinamibacterales bacterium]